LNEAEIAAGVAADDGAACTLFVMRCHDAVYTYTCRLTRDPELRQDWTHNVLLRLISDIKSGAFEYRRPGSLWAWFAKRAWFLALEERRRQNTRDRREIQSHDGELPDRVADQDPLLDLEELEAAQALAACLDAMPNPDHADAVRLAIVQDLPYQRIAEELETPVNTVRSWIRRGRVALRRCLSSRLGWTLPEEEK
jgi:RNA polymerase sigma factor (sigma-70 family)